VTLQTLGRAAAALGKELSISLKDADNLTNRGDESYPIEVEEDRAPSVRIEQPLSGAMDVADRIDQPLALGGQGGDLGGQVVAFHEEGCALASQAILHCQGDVRSQPAVGQGIADTLYHKGLDGLGGQGTGHATVDPSLVARGTAVVSILAIALASGRGRVGLPAKRAVNDPGQYVVGVASPARALPSSLVQHVLNPAIGDLVDDGLVLALVDLVMAGHEPGRDWVAENVQDGLLVPLSGAMAGPVGRHVVLGGPAFGVERACNGAGRAQVQVEVIEPPHERGFGFVHD